MISTQLILLLAWRYFRARRERGVVSLVTGFSVAGLAVGVAALIISMAVFTGFRLELRERLYDLEAPIKLHPVDQAYLNWSPELQVQVDQVPQITQVVPYLHTPSIVFQGGRAKGALFRGIPWDQINDLPFSKYFIETADDFQQNIKPSSYGPQTMY